ncbi:MAG: four helix bundle protein, partial [Candidatus Omnitrophica bacterium 4484_171]
VTRYFPKEELYGLSSQMRRAAVSIPSNVAEGFRRRHNKEFQQFLNIALGSSALGSSAELETQAVIAKELSYIDGKKEEELIDLIDYICRMASNLIKKL